MLILTRRVGEVVMIGNHTTVTVLDVKGNQTRLGVDAPREIQVHRQEVYERIKNEAGGNISLGSVVEYEKTHRTPAPKPKLESEPGPTE